MSIVKDTNNIHATYMYTLLYNSNRNRELNRVYDCRFPGPLSNCWEYYYEFEKISNEVINSVNKEDDKYNFSEFKYWCLVNFASYNMGLKMQQLGFNFDWNNYQKDDRYFKHINNCYDWRLEIFEFKNIYGNQELMIDFSQYHNFNVSLNYNKQKTNINYIYICPIYQFINWLIENNKITIIDKENFIMFYLPNKPHVHLERNEDGDIEWKDFRKAINRIFEII